MKQRGIARIVGNELVLHKFFFLINILTASLLFAIALLLIRFTSSLPNEFYKEIISTELCYFSISNADEGDISYISSLPVVIENYGADYYFSDFADSFSEEEKKVVKQTAYTLNLAAFRKGLNSIAIKKINKNILEGQKWKEEDNVYSDIMPIWISNRLAKKMNWSVSDIIELKNSDCGFLFYVKGIYKTNQELSDAYVSQELFGKLVTEGNKKEVYKYEIYCKCKSSMQTLLRTIHTLRDRYFIVYACDNTIESMNYFLFFLYFLTGILVFLSVQILENLNQLYYKKRQCFWQLNHSLGMTKRDIKKINFFLIQIITIISIIMGVILEHFLNGYFKDYIIDLFELEELDCSLSWKHVFLLYILCNILFWMYQKAKEVGQSLQQRRKSKKEIQSKCNQL